MTWWAVGSAAIGLIGNVISADSASSATQNAADTQAAATRDSTALQKDIYESTVKRNEPFVSGGTQAFNSLLERLGIGGNKDASGYGSLGKVPTGAEVMAEPGYAFGQQQGQEAIDRAANARGMSYSGAQLKAAGKFGSDYASQQYGNAFGRLQGANQQAYNQITGAAGFGQASANNTASAGQQFGAQAGANMIGAGNAQAAAGIAGSNAWQQALNQGVSSFQTYQNRSRPGGGGSSVGPGSYSNTDPESLYAQNGSDVGWRP